MYCTNCGHELPDGVNICPQCNNSIKAVEKEVLTPPTKNKNTAKTNNSQQAFLLSTLASIILIVAMIVPFISVTLLGTKIDVSLIKGDGIYFIVIAVISLICSLVRMNIGVITTGIAALALSFYKAQNLTQMKLDSKYSRYDYSNLIHKEMGFYLMFLGSALIIVAGIYGLILKKQNKVK